MRSSTRFYLTLGLLPVVCGTWQSALGFSLGIRPYAGSEMMTIPGTTLVDPEDPSKVLSGEDKKVQRAFIFYGAELAVTPVEFGKSSISALLGFRMMKSGSSGDVTDTISISYIPIGLSYDFAIYKFRASGYFAYDLGISPKFTLQVKQPANSLDLKMSGLSRMRFGGLAEIFVLKSLSLFGMADYSKGSFNSGEGNLTIKYNGTDVPVKVVAAKNSLSGLTFGGGIAFYIPAPASQSGGKSGKDEAKPPSKKPAGKAPAKKAKPKASGDGATGATPP